MKITILFFGATAEAAGVRHTEIELPDGCSADDAVIRAAEIYPQLARKNMLYAVNEAYVAPGTRLNNEDELAIFTAVSGG